MIKNILWDFDGVILDSMPIRGYGFRKIFEVFDKELVDKLIVYHEYNGGLSRFHKIKYFYNELLNKDITEEQVQDYANMFTIIMKEQLSNPVYLIEDSISFIKENYKNYNFHIVSGSENNELNYLCEKLGLTDFFLSINGSPTPKSDLVKNMMKKEKYDETETILIGDSINDYEAANSNKIRFYGYNNLALKEVSYKYLNRLGEIDC